MNEVVVLSACRTLMGRFQSGLTAFTAPQLGALAIQNAIQRAALAPEQIDEVIMGNVLSAGVGQAPARQAALGAGLPPQVPALTVNKVCGSGLKAIMLGAQAIMSGQAQVVVAGGMESMSRAPYVLPREGSKLGDRVLLDAMQHDGLVCPFSGRSMGQIADALAIADGISRAEQDEYALLSHRRALAAREAGAFRNESLEMTLAADEGPRAETSYERLAALRPVFGAAGTVTAGNAAMISDGAAAVVLASSEFATTQHLLPLARVRSMASSGTPPEDLFIAPVTAINRALDRAGLRQDDIDLFEINEAFAVQMIACLRRLELGTERVNVLGGAIALGHPIGCSGARVVVTLLHALQAREAKLGAAALCLGGGNAVAAVFESL